MEVGPTLRETSYTVWHNTYWQISGSVHSLTGWSAHTAATAALSRTPHPCCSHGARGRHLLRSSAPPDLPMDTDISWQAWAPDWSKLLSASLALHISPSTSISLFRSVCGFNFPSRLHRKLPLVVSATLNTFNVKVFKGHCSNVFVYSILFIFYHPTQIDPISSPYQSCFIDPEISETCVKSCKNGSSSVILNFCGKHSV